jgi:hypothetical protein
MRARIAQTSDDLQSEKLKVAGGGAQIQLKK